MRRSALAVLLLLGSACAPLRPAARPEPGHTPETSPRGAGMAVQTTRGRCTTAVVGGKGYRVCLPRGKQPPADTAAADTARADAPGSRVAAGGSR